MTKNLTVPLVPEVYDALAAQARENRRPLGREAQVIIEERFSHVVRKRKAKPAAAAK